MISFYLGYSQTITLTFNAKNSLTQNPMSLDSVIIQNLAGGYDTTLYGAVSVLDMKMISPDGIDAVKSLSSESLIVMQNEPNPFNGYTLVRVFLKSGEKLNLAVFNNQGNKLSEYSNTLEKGWHLFAISTNETHNMYLRVFDNTNIKTIKLISIGAGNDGNRISYKGLTNQGHETLKSTSTATGFLYYLGNQLKFTAYVGGYQNNILYDSPSVNKAYTFEMLSNTENTIPDGDHMLLGNPNAAIPSVLAPDNYLMIKPQYDLSYNNTKHIPNWTSWYLGSNWLGSVARQDNFRPDPALLSGWYAVVASEFSGSGFDRGHMCPSADRTDLVASNSATFLMTNMIPQAPKNNQVTWANLENYSRSLVSSGNELYIISGGYGQGGVGSNGAKSTVGNGVVVPAQTWKIIVVLPNGTGDLARINATTRVIAVLMPNTQSCSDQPWTYYRTSVDSIEALTGYNFLSNVSTTIQNVIEAKVDNQ